MKANFMLMQAFEATKNGEGREVFKREVALGREQVNIDGCVCIRYPDGSLLNGLGTVFESVDTVKAMVKASKNIPLDGIHRSADGEKDGTYIRLV